MYRLLFSLILCFYILGCKSQKNQQNIVDSQTNSSTESIIPNDIKEFVKNNLSSLRIPTIDLFFKEWVEYKTDKLPPYYCSSDFNGDGKSDYCLLLLDENKDLLLYAFIKSNKSYNVIFIDSLNKSSDSIGAVLSIAPKGVWESESENLKVEFDGINIDFIEESLSWSYYWDKDSFIRFLFD